VIELTEEALAERQEDGDTNFLEGERCVAFITVAARRVINSNGGWDGKRRKAREFPRSSYLTSVFYHRDCFQCSSTSPTTTTARLV
jgi:hypothetical protein